MDLLIVEFLVKTSKVLAGLFMLFMMATLVLGFAATHASDGETFVFLMGKFSWVLIAVGASSIAALLIAVLLEILHPRS